MSEKRYRYLEVGETLQSTDEYWPNGSSGWSRVSECGIDLGIGRGISLQRFFRFRRPIAEPPCEHIFRLNGKCSKCGADYQEPVVKDSLTAEEPMQELITCPHGALHTVKCGKCENGGEVGTPRVDSYTHYLVRGEWTVSRDLARQLERELDSATNARAWNKHQAQLWRETAVAAEKERDEWRDTCKALAESIFGLYAPLSNSMVLCRACNTRADSSADEHPHDTGCPVKAIDAALSAYELKAKEGV